MQNVKVILRGVPVVVEIDYLPAETAGRESPPADEYVGIEGVEVTVEDRQIIDLLSTELKAELKKLVYQKLDQERGSYV